MPTYVAFLRAINLGATRKFPKADIHAATEAAGAVDVATHINTGNVRLTSPLRSRQRVEAALESAYRDRTGFEVPTIVFTAPQLVALAEQVAELGAAPDLERHFVYLLKDEPAPDRVAALLARGRPGVEVVVGERAVHLLHGPGYRPGTVDPFGVEKALGVVATNRAAGVLTTVAQKWCR